MLREVAMRISQSFRLLDRLVAMRARSADLADHDELLHVELYAPPPH